MFGNRAVGSAAIPRSSARATYGGIFGLSARRGPRGVSNPESPYGFSPASASHSATQNEN